jgi:lipopolysaccharide transport system permease protein
MGKVIYDNNKKKLSLNLKELFDYKDLFVTLAYRDLKVRYAQTFLGFLWAFIQPLFTLLVFVIVFSKVIRVETSGIPYPLFALAGMCGWSYFSFVINQAGSSLIGAQAMIQKIYFPRLIIPLSKAVVGFVDFAIVIFLFFIIMLVYGVKPNINLLFLPIFIFLTIISALAAGIWLSALTIRYRDFQVILPFIVQFGLYITPIAYPVSMIPEKYKILFYLNPMTAIVQGFRWCLLGISPPDMYCYLSFAIVGIIFISGLYYFRKTERIMADIL